MRYASVCDGIGAVHVAWQPLGWKCQWTSEIDAFPAAVVAERWGFENYGDALMHNGASEAFDFMRWEDSDDQKPELIVSGTPCQSFSVAGLRKGLRDPRGGLMLTFIEIAQRYRPRWLVWENVPGVLSSNGGRDFGSLLGALGHMGYGWSYRVLDAQWLGVAQRRRRVFLVASLGDQRSAAAILFERESVRRDNPPKRETRQELAYGFADGAQVDGIAKPLGGDIMGRGRGTDLDNTTYVAFTKSRRAQSSVDDETWVPGVVAPTVNCFDQGDSRTTVAVAHRIGVRRMTPRECERLQGFPDDYTAIAFRGKPAADSPRYKAIGNSMAVPVMRWLGARIDAVERAAGRS